MTDLGAVARMVAFETAFSALNHIDEHYAPAASNDAPGWILMELDPAGNLTGRDVAGLHEDILTIARMG